MRNTSSTPTEAGVVPGEAVRNLRDFKGGWFVGDFEPALVKTPGFEVGVKYYRKGDTESEHVHRVAWEITAVVSGSVQLNGKVLGPGDLILVKPAESVRFLALEDSATVIVKCPSVPGDKYPCE
jgi:hypothetical protein